MVTDLVHTLYQREMEVKAGQRGSFSVVMDLSSWFSKSTSSSFLFFPSHNEPYISSLQISQQVQMRLSTSSTLALIGSATSAEGQGQGVLGAVLQHSFSPDQNVTLSLLTGSQRHIAVEFNQLLTPSLLGILFTQYNEDGIRTDVKLQTQLTEALRGNLILSMKEIPSCEFGAEYIMPSSKLSATAFISNDLGVNGAWNTTLSAERGEYAKISLLASLQKWSLGTQLKKDLSPFSKASVGVDVASTGVVLNLKYRLCCYKHQIPTGQLHLHAPSSPLSLLRESLGTRGRVRSDGRILARVVVMALLFLREGG